MAKKGENIFDAFTDKINSFLGGFEKPFSNITLSNKKTVINVDLPKIKRKDLDLTINEDSVTVKAEVGKKNSKSYRVYYREIQLPAGVNTDRAVKRFRRGSLTIEIPIKK